MLAGWSSAVRDEPELVRAVDLIGSGAFMFPRTTHEVSPQKCKEELAELQQQEGLSYQQKADILGETARRFYNLS